MNGLMTGIVLGLAGLFSPPGKPREIHRVPYIMDAETGVIILEPTGGAEDESFIRTDPKTRESTLYVVDPKTGKVTVQPYNRFVAPKIS